VSDELGYLRPRRVDVEPGVLLRFPTGGAA
jgi:hypothetical protein